MAFNLGNYASGLTSDLTTEEQNGALANVGSDYRVPTTTATTDISGAGWGSQPQTSQPQTQTQQQDGWQQAQKYVGATQGLTAQEGEKNGLDRALGIVSKIYSFGGS
jgi:hypothetical protein